MAYLSVKEFYKDKNVFITGGTGFFGHLFIEKLLRCTDVSKLYVLLRNKKDKKWQERLDSILANPLFDILKADKPAFKDRIVGVEGDCTLPRLGLTKENYDMLLQNVHIVFHSAATIRFIEPLSVALKINVLGTKNVIDFCKEIKQLLAFVHISTAFTNCIHPHMKEEVYEPTSNMLKVLQNLDDKDLDAKQNMILEKFPNTYIFSKNLAEYIVKETASYLPTVIFRPSIVSSTYDQPVFGWTNNSSSISVGPIYAAAVCISRVIPIKKGTRATLVPGDMVINAVLASAWDIALTKHQRGQEIPVYNYVPDFSNQITLERFFRIQLSTAKKMPLKRCIWYYEFYILENLFIAKTLFYVNHIIPSKILDFILFMKGMKFRLKPIYKKIKRLWRITPYFYYNEWKWDTNKTVGLWKKLNTADQSWLLFDMSQVKWEEYAENSYFGMRRYIAKEDDSTIEDALNKQKIFWYIHIGYRCFWISIGFLILFYIIQAFF